MMLEQMDKLPPIVEVAVNSDRNRVPLGLMNTEQALTLPEGIDFEVSHTEYEAGATEIFISKSELLKHVSEGEP